MLRSTRERSLTGAKGPLANGPALRGGPYRSGCSAGSVIVAIAAVGRNLGVIDILSGALQKNGRVSAQTRWVARCRRLWPLSSTHM